MNAIAGIVTYNPELKRLAECIAALTVQKVNVVIVDNGSQNAEQIAKMVAEATGAAMVKNGENKGIAYALNQLFLFAEEHHYDWVLSLDQDTIVPNGLVDLYAPHTEDPKIAVLCPVIYDHVTGREWPKLAEGERVRRVERCITSGSLNRVSAWASIHGFDEYLFIDEVDHDFCMRLVRGGWEILLVADAKINHQIGETKVYYLLGKPIFVRNHSAFRKYYMVRNMLYMSRKHNGRITAKTICHAVAFMGKMLIYENNKFEKMKACLRGFRDGFYVPKGQV